MATVVPSWISKQNNFSNSQSLYAPMPPIKFQLHPTYGLGGDVVFEKFQTMTAVLDIGKERNDFSNSVLNLIYTSGADVI